MPVPSTIDLVAPFDPTAYASISGAQLLQLVSGLAPYTDKGLVIATADVGNVPEVPDATTETKWRTYIWLRLGATAATPYIWNENASDHTDGATPPNNILKWYTIASASIGVGTITGDMIADFTIPSGKIISLDASKLYGTLPGTITTPPSGPAGGDLTGTYPNPSVANLAITTGKIALLNITNGLIAGFTIDATTKIAPNAVAYTQLRTNAGMTALEYFVPNVIVDLANPIAGDSLKLVRVNVGETGYEKVALSTITKVITQMTLVTGVSINATGVLNTTAHGLAGIPQIVNWVLVNTSTEGGYAVNDEVPIEHVTDAGRRCYARSADATNVKLLASTVFNVPQVLNKTTGADFSIDKTKWTAKCYAYYLS